jgi:hypothetical protein
MLTVAVPKQDFLARKLKCPFFNMVYKSLLTNVFTTFCLILNKICGRKSATWPWHMAASPNPIVSNKDKSESTQSRDEAIPFHLRAIDIKILNNTIY